MSRHYPGPIVNDYDASKEAASQAFDHDERLLMEGLLGEDQFHALHPHLAAEPQPSADDPWAEVDAS